MKAKAHIEMNHERHESPECRGAEGGATPECARPRAQQCDRSRRLGSSRASETEDVAGPGDGRTPGRGSALVILLIAFASLSPALAAAETNAASQQLHALFAEDWEHTMERSPTWASELGDRRWNDRWDDLSLATAEREQQRTQATLQRLLSIPRAQLSEGDRLNFDLFKFQTELGLEEYRQRTFLLAISQRGGIQTADELADSLRFENVKDYEDWLTRLGRFPVLMDQTIALLRQGVRERRVQTKITMKRVPAQIAKQIVAKPEDSPFFKPFATFPAAVAPADRERLTAAARRAVSDSVIPAYRRLQKFFDDEYFPACFDGVGAWQWPDGTNTYAFLARKFTTTKLTPQEIHDLGLREVKRIGDEMQRVMEQVGFKGTRPEFFHHLRSDPKFYCRTPAELLTEYRATAKRVDPQLVRFFKVLPRVPYGVEPIPDKIAPDTTAAYYRVLAADGSRAGTYFVNLYKPEMRPRYEMMALTLHEAVPGHHLQFALAFEQGELPKFRRYGGEGVYTAYIEGWALYAESLGDEMGLYDDPYSKFGQLTYEMWRAVRLVVDTGMHAFKWERQRAIDYFLANAAKSELDVTNEVDRYISWPGQALAYKIGELKIKELRAAATRELGAKFDLRDFHDLLLKSGAVPLEVLEQNVREWIGRMKAGR